MGYWCHKECDFLWHTKLPRLLFVCHSLTAVNKVVTMYSFSYQHLSWMKLGGNIIDLCESFFGFWPKEIIWPVLLRIQVWHSSSFFYKICIKCLWTQFWIVKLVFALTVMKLYLIWWNKFCIVPHSVTPTEILSPWWELVVANGHLWLKFSDVWNFNCVKEWLSFFVIKKKTWWHDLDKLCIVPQPQRLMRSRKQNCVF